MTDIQKCGVKKCNHQTDGKHKMCNRHLEYARKGWSKVPKEERQRRNSERYTKHGAKMLEYAKKQHTTARNAVLEHYGKVCVHCGITDIDVLTIDHIENNGNEHRKTVGKGGLDISLWLIRNNFPAGFQTLCRNCNWKKHILNLRRGNG